MWRAIALSAYRSMPLPVRRLCFAGDSRYCPVCESHVSRFVAAGVTGSRPDARCPVCGSEERQRIAMAFARSRTDLLSSRPKRLLHVGSSKCLEDRLGRVQSLEYVPADLEPVRGQIRVDITDLAFPAGHFDMVWCCHVLEHVVDDIGAMGELRRVLRPAGLGIIQVPISSEETIEDPSVVDPEERRLRFGQADHVRRYGRDFASRLESAGFSVDVVSPGDLLSEEERESMAIPDDEEVFACTNLETDVRG